MQRNRGGNTVISHANEADKLLIKGNSGRQTDAAVHARTIHSQRHAHTA
jgi:hypothetical protein